MTIKPRDKDTMAMEASDVSTKATKVAARMLARQRARAALNIQRWWRGACVRCVAPHTRRAVLVQVLFRSRCERVKFTRLVAAAGCIQRRVKRFLAQARFRRQLESRRGQAALCIQRIWRGACDRRKATVLKSSRRHSAAIQIQAFFRMYLARTYLVRMIKSALELKRRIEAANKISQVWKGVVARRRFKSQRSAALAIQVAVRLALRRRRAAELKAAVHIQRKWRHCCADRAKREELHSRPLHEAAVKIQCCHRGTTARRLLASQGVLLGTNIRRDARGVSMRCEARRYLRGSWRFVVAAVCLESGCLRRHELTITSQQASALLESLGEASSTTLAAQLFLQALSIEWANGQHILSLPVTSCDAVGSNSTAGDHEKKAEGAAESLLAAAEAELQTQPPQMPWKCTTCAFLNEVSPDVCVLCDEVRDFTVQIAATPLRPSIDSSLKKKDPYQDPVPWGSSLRGTRRSNSASRGTVTSTRSRGTRSTQVSSQVQKRAVQTSRA